MVRIVCFSDSHGQHKAKKLNNWFEKNPADILVFAGDLQLNSLDDGTDFLKWISNTPYTYKIVTFGNHDGNYEIFTNEARKFKDVIILNQKGKRVMGINFFGSPYSLNFYNWWFMKSEKELADLYDKIPNDTQVLITHTPVYGILDKSINGFSCGSESLKDKIEKLPKLKYHICGHIHEGYGKEKHGKITYINGSLLNYRYEMVNEPIKFTI